MIRIHVAFVDGSAIDKEYPDHEIEEVEIMVRDLTEEFIVQVELEDRNQKTTYTYKRKTTYAY